MSYGMQSPRGPTGIPSMGSSTGNFNMPKEKIPKGFRQGSINQFTPEQLGLFQQLFGHLGPESYLSSLAGGDQSMFAEMEAPAMRQFQELQGQLGSRFSGSGMGARRGSGFQNVANQATQDFASQLQANRLGLRQQALQDLMSYSNMLLGQRPQEKFLYEKQQKQSSGLGGLLGAGLGGVGGFFAGGPMGSLQGAQLGYGIGSQF